LSLLSGFQRANQSALLLTAFAAICFSYLHRFAPASQLLFFCPVIFFFRPAIALCGGFSFYIQFCELVKNFFFLLALLFSFGTACISYRWLRYL
jgi:hypothetical protein